MLKEAAKRHFFSGTIEAREAEKLTHQGERTVVRVNVVNRGLKAKSERD